MGAPSLEPHLPAAAPCSPPRSSRPHRTGPRPPGSRWSGTGACCNIKALSLSSRMKAVGGGGNQEGHRVDVGLQPRRDCLSIRSPSPAEEVDIHRPPELDDRTAPPDGRLLGGTGGRSSRGRKELVGPPRPRSRASWPGQPSFPSHRPRTSESRRSTPSRTRLIVSAAAITTSATWKRACAT